ncbi:unnamed protein product, partial [Durusdinium trenchii]
FLKKKVYDDPPGSFAVEMTRCRYSAILMKLISISQSLRLALVTATSKLITE